MGKGFTVHSLPALFVCLSGDQLAHTNSTIFGQDQSTVAQRAETTVAECFPDELCVSSLSLISSHTMPGQHSWPFSTL